MKKMLLVTLALTLVLWAAVPAAGQQFGRDDCSNDAESEGGDGGDGGIGVGAAGAFGGSGLGGDAEGGDGGDIDQNSRGCNESYTSDDDTSQEQGFEQNFDSDDLEQPVDISVPGDNSGVCMPVQSTGITGNLGSEQGLEPLSSSSDDSGVEGNANGEFGPVMTTDCAPTISQDATNQL